MPSDILGSDVSQALADAQRRAAQRSTKSVTVDGKPVQIQSPFPSPADWRDCWIYFLMTDRFNNPSQAPKAPWDQKFNFRQGGTFEGIRQQLPYLQQLGVGAIWISPVLKNSKPEVNGFEYTYPGYNAQDFLNIDERFASDGTRATAERELAALVDEAHARGIYVVLDIVLNHAGRVFDYVYGGGVTSSFTDAGLLNDPSRPEPAIQWIDGTGAPRSVWQDNLPAPATLSPDDAAWPTDLQRKEFFRRRGNKVSDTPGPRGYVPGDFGTMRQLVVEYDAGVPGQEALREKYGPSPVLSILITAYQYLIAKYDFDAFRIDTVKYIRPDMVESFGNAIREFALSIGKANFFTFGEIYDSEDEINQFIGRNSGDTEGFGLDAALDFPLFYNLPGVAKASIGVEQIRQVFEKRKAVEKDLISSHGEAGRYFVSFLDNHDQNRRFNDPGTPAAQVTLGLAVLFALQGIPCVYYGTEQGLQGTNDVAGHPTLDSNESVREAPWGKKPTAFDTTNPFFSDLQAIAQLRASEPALRYGRLYFRPISGNNADFGQSSGTGGVIAFSRILGQREIVIIANTSFNQPFSGSVLVDYDLHAAGERYSIQYSNQGTSGGASVAVTPGRIFDDNGNATSMTIASIPCKLAPMEVQIFAPDEILHECFLNDVKEARSRRCVHFLHYNSTRSIIRLALRQLAGRVANRVVGIEELVGLPQADEATMFANGAMKRGKYQKKSAGGTLDDRKIRLRRYERTAILVGLTTGVFAVLAFEAALAIGARWHARWATLLDSSLQRTIAALFVTIPISIAIILAGRAKKKLMGDETAAKEAEFKLRLLAERSGVGWRVPRSAEAADWPKVVVITLVFYIVVFVIAGTICFVFMMIDRWIPSRRDLDKDITPLHAAFLCANVVGVTIPTLFILMAGVFPRVKVTLISEGVLKRYGSMQNLIPYSAIQKVCIVPSPRRRSLNSFAILSTELGFPHWNHFEFGKDAPVNEIIKAFEAKGFAVVAKP